MLFIWDRLPANVSYCAVRTYYCYVSELRRVARTYVIHGIQKWIVKSPQYVSIECRIVLGTCCGLFAKLSCEQLPKVNTLNTYVIGHVELKLVSYRSLPT